MIRICSAASTRQTTFWVHSRVQFSTEIALNHRKTVGLEKRVDDQKEKVKRTDFFPIESMTLKEEEKLTREGLKTVRTFNEMLRRAKEKAKSSHTKQ